MSKGPVSAAHREAARANLEKAHEVNRQSYVFTPARRAALDAARKKRRFALTPAKLAALRKATEAARAGWQLTPARRRAMGINIRKMQKGSVEKFQMTERRDRAIRANLRKAWAKQRAPESYTRSRFNDLKHGLQARSIEESIELLGEDRKEFARHLARLRQAFAPANPSEEKVVRLIAAATWRRLRLFHAQARWESDRLKRFFRQPACLPPRDPEQTRWRGLALISLLTDYRRLARHEQSLVGVVEREIRTLLRLRAGGNADFRLYSRQSERACQRFRALEKELERQEQRIEDAERDPRFSQRLRAGGPEVEAALARFKWGS